MPAVGTGSSKTRGVRSGAKMDMVKLRETPVDLVGTRLRRRISGPIFQGCVASIHCRGIPN